MEGTRSSTSSGSQYLDPPLPAHSSLMMSKKDVLCFRTLVHAAAAAGNTELVLYLLDKGASPNTSDDEASNTTVEQFFIKSAHCVSSRPARLT